MAYISKLIEKSQFDSQNSDLVWNFDVCKVSFYGYIFEENNKLKQRERA